METAIVHWENDFIKGMRVTWVKGSSCLGTKGAPF